MGFRGRGSRLAQIDVEILGPGREHARFDAGFAGAPVQAVCSKIACRVIVAKDIKTAKARRVRPARTATATQSSRLTKLV